MEKNPTPGDEKPEKEPTVDEEPKKEEDPTPDPSNYEYDSDETDRVIYETALIIRHIRRKKGPNGKIPPGFYLFRRPPRRTGGPGAGPGSGLGPGGGGDGGAGAGAGATAVGE